MNETRVPNGPVCVVCGKRAEYEFRMGTWLCDRHAAGYTRGYFDAMGEVMEFAMMSGGRV